MLQPSLEKSLGQRLVLDYKAGAGGNVASEVVANAKPDGYTILMALSSITVIPAADALFNRKPAYSHDQYRRIR